jgi:hypothetical protein
MSFYYTKQQSSGTWALYNERGYAKGGYETEALAQARCDKLNWHWED